MPKEFLMIKHVSLTNRWDLLTHEEYLKRYLLAHQGNKQIPGLVRYLGSPVIQDSNGGDPPFDSMSEMYWSTVDEVRDAFSSKEWQTVRTGQPQRVGGRFMFLVDELSFLDKIPSGYDQDPSASEIVKYVALLNRKDGMTRDEFLKYWIDQHVPLALDTPGLLRYHASPTLQSFNGDNGTRPDPEPAPWDGVVEMWFENREAFTESFRDEYWEQVRTDMYRNLAMGRVAFLVKEHLVFERGQED
jgi:uncharacterized protein (TIGR02118 family)